MITKTFSNCLCRFCNQELRSFWVLHQPLPCICLRTHASQSGCVEVWVWEAVGEATGFLRTVLSLDWGWAGPRVRDYMPLQPLSGDLYPTVKPEQESPINLSIWFFFFFFFLASWKASISFPVSTCKNSWRTGPDWSWETANLDNDGCSLLFFK